MDWASKELPRTLLNAQIANKRKVALEISFKACPVDDAPLDVLIPALNRRSTYTERNKPARSFKICQVGVPCTQLVVYLVDDDVSISQNKGIISSRGIDRRNVLSAGRIHKRLASTRLNGKSNRILAIQRRGHNRLVG